MRKVLGFFKTEGSLPGANVSDVRSYTKLGDRVSVHFPCWRIVKTWRVVGEGTHSVWGGLLWSDLILLSFPKSISSILTTHPNTQARCVVWGPTGHAGLKSLPGNCLTFTQQRMSRCIHKSYRQSASLRRKPFLSKAAPCLVATQQEWWMTISTRIYSVRVYISYEGRWLPTKF